MIVALRGSTFPPFYYQTWAPELFLPAFDVIAIGHSLGAIKNCALLMHHAMMPRKILACRNIKANPNIKFVWLEKFNNQIEKHNFVFKNVTFTHYIDILTFTCQLSCKTATLLYIKIVIM